jgi:hypothetical protein
MRGECCIDTVGKSLKDDIVKRFSKEDLLLFYLIKNNNMGTKKLYELVLDNGQTWYWTIGVNESGEREIRIYDEEKNQTKVDIQTIAGAVKDYITGTIIPGASGATGE